jgi:outer membrane protein assembly factor BamB
MRAPVCLALLLALCDACSGPSSDAAAPATSAPLAAQSPTAANPLPAAGAASPGASPSARAAGSASASPSASAGPAASPVPGGTGSGGGAGGGGQTDWLTYQHDLARSGQTAGAYRPAGTAMLWESDPLDGQIYAQVLVAGDRAFVATENDTIYALDVATGRNVWAQHLGEPVPRSALPCGNIDPTGITSTPVIDAAAGLLYAVDYLRQPPHHELVALDLSSGTVKFHQPIDPPGANPLPYQQRGALAIANQTVYVPFGGLLGDCGDYHGWIVAASPVDGSQRGAYEVPTHREGAIWAAPAFSPAGDLYAATGNGDSSTDFDQSNTVLRLSPDLKLLDFFAPRDWADLNRRDADLGSTGPTLLDNGLILQIGKSGIGYLLQADHLGQIGGEIMQAALCAGGAYGGSAHAGAMVYVACRDGLYAVRVQAQAFNVVWRGPQFSAGAPLITDDAVWTLDDGTSSLYALNPQDGNVVFRAPAGQGSNPPHFLTPSAAGGRIFHSRGKTVAAYGAS